MDSRYQKSESVKIIKTVHKVTIHKKDRSKYIQSILNRVPDDAQVANMAFSDDGSCLIIDFTEEKGYETIRR